MLPPCCALARLPGCTPALHQGYAPPPPPPGCPSLSLPPALQALVKALQAPNFKEFTDKASATVWWLLTHAQPLPAAGAAGAAAAAHCLSAGALCLPFSTLHCAVLHMPSMQLACRIPGAMPLLPNCHVHMCRHPMCLQVLAVVAPDPEQH